VEAHAVSAVHARSLVYKEEPAAEVYALLSEEMRPPSASARSRKLVGAVLWY
jgi:hypothetical protein